VRRNGYTAAQFIKAIKDSGGIISTIADVVGCSWITAKKYITDYPTVNEAWNNERNRITDKARHNIITAIGDKDLQMSKWWLQVMDDEFTPRTKQEVIGAIQVKDNRFEQSLAKMFENDK